MTNYSNYSFFGKIAELRKWLIVCLIAVILYLGYKLFINKGEATVVEYDTALIQQQLKNVGKLVVTEGHFAEVMTYKDSKKYMGDWLSFEKKAIVVINADVTVSFDMRQVKYELDLINKTVNVISIPKEEIKIHPDYKYYNIDESTFNEFSAQDYNKINKVARANLAKKIEQSNLKKNAKSRFLNELNNILIITNSLGWKLKSNGMSVVSEKEISEKFLN